MYVYKGGASPCSQSDRLPQDGQTPSAQGSARGAIQGARGTPGRGKRLARHGLGLTTSHACAYRRSGRVRRVKRAGQKWVTSWEVPGGAPMQLLRAME
ncbi:hypothetical protein KI387_022770 [Taxus chinensis]|uniref:Uncharacterized protein n=1 Tax=Taxus chinensis TaxID=29808 RepID=A0AA38G2N9_TAXCH|nr:hypothetical protein KI387_022770 [Taxus chinensis]